jgi:membrane-bound lytic murein transglycosylase D
VFVVVAVLILVLGFLADPVRADSPSRASSADLPPRPLRDAGAAVAAGSAADPLRDDANGTDADEDAPVLRELVERLTAEIDALRELVTGLAAQVATTRPALHSYRLPATIAFAGTAVPLDRWDIAERLEREFYLVLGDSAQVILWLKRSARYFPYIERELRAAGLPDDLKYVAVVESSLRPQAYSWAHASGIWQFIPDTARAYGLRVTNSWDERRDPARSTAAAIAYLTDLHKRFRDWPLALAAYNAGERRVDEAMKQQGVATYYQLSLPAETERYFFRILAAKVILKDPGRYGFEVPPEDRYSPHETDTVDLRVLGSVHVRDVAKASGSFYRQIRAMNPAIMSERLPEGRYEIHIPRGGRATLDANLPELKRAMAAPRARRIEYRVKSGDTLGSIAGRFGVTVSQIQQWNQHARGRHIRPGDRLLIERPGG